jgi:aryl-alcohol dehydrogenase-like predicted oxidoreductase
MEMRVFGRTNMRLSLLGFGCGAVGGLMVRGDPRDQERAIARAIDGKGPLLPAALERLTTLRQAFAGEPR